jgi:NADH-quinone oxidoreductase subunit L
VAQLAVVAAMFHLFTHAFFKALLFLASGSVMHAMGDVIDMRRFRGLRHRLPYTCATFAVGALALSGVVPLSGFFSKDEILAAIKSAPDAAREIGLGWHWIYYLVYLLALVTSFMTAFYTGRAFFMTFWGSEKLPSVDDPEVQETVAVSDSAAHGHSPAQDAHAGAADHAHGHGDGGHVGHESPPLMVYPLFVLAGCTVLIGLVCLVAGPFAGTTEWFAHHLHSTFAFESLGHFEHHFDWLTAILGTLAAVGGIGLSYVIYGEDRVSIAVTGRLKPLYEASLHKFYVDEFYEWVIARTIRGAGIICDFVDAYFVDGLARGIAKIPRGLGRNVLSKYQNGLIQFYAGASVLCVAVILLLLLVLSP